ncbi:MAG: hypothetical protein WBG42_04230 [Cryomorphaceae bacterium]
MEFEKEDRIRKRKDKKLSKHFEGAINDLKIKFLNFRFKTHTTPKETIDVIEIISKIKFQELDKEGVLIRLTKEDLTVEINGDWKYGWSGPGEYCVAYSVKKKTERKSS